MCVVCGCSEPGVEPVRPSQADDLHFGQNEVRVSVPGLSTTRAIRIEQDVLGANNAVAARNRAQFAAHGVAAFNLVSSPGSGKTTLLCATIEAMRHRLPDQVVAVIEGDQQTSVDADRIRATGAPAIQINTGKGCHLDAPMVEQAFARLHRHYHPAHEHGPGHEHDHPAEAHHHGHTHGQAHDHAHGVLFIENVGNLVCPALWDLGETAKVAILSVTEGEDKPLKYPDMFAASQLMILNKIDLLPHLQFDLARCRDHARRVNPTIEIIELSATSGAGMPAWLDWIERHTPGRHSRHEHEHEHAAQDQLARLTERVRTLEAELARARAAGS